MPEVQPRFDRRQSKIHEQLVRLIGPGPAGFFRDVCRLFQDPPPFESAGNMAANSLRELKSAIKDVLLPGKEAKGDNADEKNIKEIAAAFGLASDHDIVRLWTSLDLATLTHRDNLNPPRSIDDVREAWETFQDLLSMLLDSFESVFADVYKRIDAIVSKEPTTRNVKYLLGRVPNNPHVWAHIFSQVQGCDWLRRFVKAGVFNNPPSFGFWPQAQYLNRMAETCPEDVGPVLESVMETWNYFTHHNALEALRFIEPAAAGRVLERSAEAVRHAKEHDTYLALEIAKKAAAITDKQLSSALNVFSTLLKLERENGASGERGYRGARELVSALGYHTYADIVGEPLHRVIEIAPQQLIGRLVEVLDVALLSVYAGTKPKDFSKGWMPAIEPHEQNTYHYEALPRLVEGIRDAAEVAVAADPVALQPIVEDLIGREWQILDRLALHLLGRFGDPNEDFVQRLLVDEKMFFNYDLRHEYGVLLRRIYPALSNGDQNRLRSWMVEGPRYIPATASEEDREYVQKAWSHQRLSWIRDNLPRLESARLRELDAEFGAADETDDFSGYISGPFSGPTSPKNADDLKSMKVPKIVDYLREWQPSGEHMFMRGGFAPTREGLGRQLQDIVKARAAEFAAAADSFVDVDVTYLRAMVNGLTDAVKDGVAFDWFPVLRLCAWSVAQPRQIPGRDAKRFDSDADWGGARAAIARLLTSGFRAKGDARLPDEARRQAWAVLLPITDDPDPEPTRETEERDAFSIAINSTRGAAIEAVFQYVQWIRGGFKAPREANAFSDVPEVEPVLERHLNVGVDPSRAIRAMYGQWLFFLHVLFPGWIAARRDVLFPTDRPELADAVLDSYLAWGQYMSPEFNQLLSPVLRRSIEVIEPGEEEPSSESKAFSRLGQRVIAMYLYGEFELVDDSLVARFFARAGKETRVQVLSLVPQTITQEDDAKQTQMRDRAVALWEWRVTTSTDDDLRAFGQWVESPLFDAGWRLAQLRSVLDRIGKVDVDYRLIQTLGDLSSQFPAETFYCARAIIETGMDPMRVYGLTYRGDLQRIVHVARLAGNDELRKDATGFANTLVARGFTDFRKVLEPDYQPPGIDDEE
jgi:hypothetical protein